MKKYILEISIAVSATLMIVCGCLTCNNVQLRHENMILTQGIGDRDSIIENQNEFIIQLTYQHEDDDRLMEEEQP